RPPRLVAALEGRRLDVPRRGAARARRRRRAAPQALPHARSLPRVGRGPLPRRPPPAGVTPRADHFATGTIAKRERRLPSGSRRAAGGPTLVSSAQTCFGSERKFAPFALSASYVPWTSSTWKTTHGV